MYLVSYIYHFQWCSFFLEILFILICFWPEELSVAYFEEYISSQRIPKVIVYLKMFLPDFIFRGLKENILFLEYRILGW